MRFQCVSWASKAYHGLQRCLSDVSLQKPTGLIRKPCVHLLMIFSHLISLEGRLSSGFQLSRKASGKLTSGWSTIPRNFGIGCMSNIWILSLTCCTGVHQPCDVGIQQPPKLSTRKSCHKDIINNFLKELDKGNPMLSLNDSLGVICDQSMRWMWNAYQALDNKELVKKVC